MEWIVNVVTVVSIAVLGAFFVALSIIDEISSRSYIASCNDLEKKIINEYRNRPFSIHSSKMV